MDEDNSNETMIIEEKKYNIITDKNNEMELYLRNYNNEKLSISFYSIKKINQKPLKKFELKDSLEKFKKNRFFKIFINIEEIIKELDTKIEKSTFIEETNEIIIYIPIGLTVINEIILEIKENEKNKDEIIEELMKKNEEKEKKIIELMKNKEEMDKKNNELMKNKEEMDKKNNELTKEIENKNNELIKMIEKTEKKHKNENKKKIEEEFIQNFKSNQN